MEKIDFVELGQSFSVSCEKPQRGGERRNLTHLAYAFPNVHTQDWNDWNMAKQAEEKHPV